jgi:hypothetical protein
VEGEASHRENYQANFPKPGKAGTTRTHLAL